MNRLKKITAALAVVAGLAAQSHAATSDALTVTITPNAFYAVAIDTTNVQLDLGTVTLGTSTQTVRPSTVTINSTYATTDLKLQGSISSSGTPWTFDDNTTSTEASKIAAWATFTSVARSSVPVIGSDYFSGTAAGSPGSDVIDAVSRYVGSSANDGTTNLFENNSGFDAKDMDAMAPAPAASGTSQLWLNFRLPNSTADNAAQNITITLTAVQVN